TRFSRDWSSDVCSSDLSLKNVRGTNLYSFWGDILTEALNEELSRQEEPLLINLASNEYFKAVKPKKLQGQLITPQFLDLKSGKRSEERRVGTEGRSQTS